MPNLTVTNSASSSANLRLVRIEEPGPPPVTTPYVQPPPGVAPGESCPPIFVASKCNALVYFIGSATPVSKAIDMSDGLDQTVEFTYPPPS